jgi:hypothetical protein
VSRPTLRDAYGAIERQLAPLLDALVRSSRFVELGATVVGTRVTASGSIGDLTARLLHAVNLPAGTDVKRLRRQIGELDREVRQLRLQLELRPSDGAR